jgi:hypothetical protein
MRLVRVLSRVVVIACAGAIALQAVTLWRETRIENLTFTRYYDPARDGASSREPGGGLSDLFAGTGLEDNTGTMETIPNRFMLGLLPAGPGRDAISVLTLAGPAALIALLALAGLAREALAGKKKTTPRE